MILEREQINRYLRHIILPEVSGAGQKKLLESTISIYAENVRGSAALTYYLAASGIGHIQCNYIDPEGFDDLYRDINDLNNDVTVEMGNQCNSDFGIYIGHAGFYGEKICRSSSGFVPSVISIFRGWKGGIKTFRTTADLDAFLSCVGACTALSGVRADNQIDGAEVLSGCLSSALCALEAVKFLLGLGEPDGDFTYFDLLSLKFLKCDVERFMAELTDAGYEELSQQKLRKARLLIVGVGGLGSPAAYALSQLGVGTIGLADYDIVEISNLNRQILHSTSRIGQFKAESASTFLKRTRADVNIAQFKTAITKDNVCELIRDYDIIIDAVDNFPTRFLLNDACYFAEKPLIDAGAVRFDGTCTTFIRGDGPCYRCILSDIPAPGSVPSCSEVGVLGPVPGIMGFLQASEAAKLISGIGTASIGRIIYFDGLYSEFRIIELGKRNRCPLCGDNPKIRDLQDYGFICEDKLK